MTAESFEEYCERVNKIMKQEDRRILLIVDNVSSHKNEKQFDNVELLFLPPNTTSIMQPIDQGVVLSFKSNYRKRVVERDFMEKTSREQLPQISMADAIKWMSESWAEVQATVIRNCWKKSGLWVEEESRMDSHEERQHQFVNHIPIVAEDCVFDWILEEEETDLQQEENDYTIERCLDRAFESVVGSSSSYCGADVNVLLTQLEDLETFLFFYVRELVYADSLLIDVLSRLECFSPVSNDVPFPSSPGSEVALANTVAIKRFLVYRYGFNTAFNLRLSEIRSFLCEEE
ncbi:hypothetical protein RCL1_005760 [Eukaryota sp. TZLM3-RCL]